MLRPLLLTLATVLATPTPAPASEITKITTGPTKGTYREIGLDLARMVAEPAGLSFEVMTSKGSAENVRRLRFEPGVRLALVQSDVYQAFLDEAAGGNLEATGLIEPLRVVLPLYAEEMYFVVRADSPLTRIQQIKDKRINVGPVGSGTALSATTAYRQMFGAPITAAKASFLPPEQGLIKLLDGSLDVVVVVAGQPARLFADMTAEARQHIRILDLDPEAPETRASAETYAPGWIRASSYPNLLTRDVPTLTVRAMLVTYNFQSPAQRTPLERFARSLCDNLANLQTKGHPKWREVKLDMPLLGKGWSYYGPTAQALASCAAGTGAGGTPACQQSHRMLGLCRG